MIICVKKGFKKSFNTVKSERKLNSSYIQLENPNVLLTKIALWFVNLDALYLLDKL